MREDKEEEFPAIMEPSKEYKYQLLKDCFNTPCSRPYLNYYRREEGLPLIAFEHLKVYDAVLGLQFMRYKVLEEAGQLNEIGRRFIEEYVDINKDLMENNEDLSRRYSESED